MYRTAFNRKKKISRLVLLIAFSFVMFAFYVPVLLTSKIFKRRNAD